MTTEYLRSRSCRWSDIWVFRIGNPARYYPDCSLVSALDAAAFSRYSICLWNLLRAFFTETHSAYISGPIGAARNLESLQKSGITHVLNASPVIPCFHKRHLRYKKIIVYDDPDDDISRYFDESNRFIQKVQLCKASNRDAMARHNNNLYCEL